MPLITAAESSPPVVAVPETPPPAAPPEVNWGKVGDDVRMIEIAEDKSSAIYVIEEAPGKKNILHYSSKYSLEMPWIYFFVQAFKDATVSSFSGMYILFSKTRQETLEEETLLIPYLPNLFRHGGVCMNHTAVYKARTPMNVVRLAIGWFWDSNGSALWSFVETPPELSAKPGSYNEPPAIEKWKNMSAEEALKISWTVPRFKSVKAAVKGLSFKYYTKEYYTERTAKCVNDMTGELQLPF